MIQTYNFNNYYIEKSNFDDSSWLSLTNPSEDEIEKISVKYNYDKQTFLKALDPQERPHYNQNKNIKTIVVRAPIFTNNTVTTIPVTFIIINNNLLITVCTKENFLMDLLKNFHNQNKYLWTPEKLTLKILKIIACTYVDILDEMEKLTDSAEKKIGKKQNTEFFLFLLSLEKTLINVIVSLKTNQLVMEALNQATINEKEEEKYILNTALIENQQALFTAEIFNKTLSSIGDAFNNIINNNLNYIMKILTGVTIILMIPTIIVGLYGMNVRLPLEEYPQAFWMLCFIMVFFMLILILIFIRKNWL